MSSAYIKGVYENANRHTKLIFFVVRVLLKILFTTLNHVLFMKTQGINFS